MINNITQHSHDREKFLSKFFDLYKTSFTSANASLWLDAYKRVLPTNADFESLFNKLIFEYSGSSAPKPAWFVDKITYKQDKAEEKEKEKVWTGSIIASKSGIDYEFAFGGQAPNLEKSTKWLEKEGFLIKQITEG